jgi:hypothetical protein
MSKSTTIVEENDWTFGQVLPAFLLIGPVATAIKAVFDQNTGHTNSGMLASSPSDERSTMENDVITIIEPEYTTESLDMRRFRQHMFNCIKRNYYDTATCPWILPLIFFMCIQVLEITILMFLELVLQRTSAALVLLAFSYLIITVFPSATYILVFGLLVLDHHGPTKYRWIYFLSLPTIILGVYSTYPIWGVLYSPDVPQEFRSSQDIFVLGISIGIIGVAGASFVVPAITI